MTEYIYIYISAHNLLTIFLPLNLKIYRKVKLKKYPLANIRKMKYMNKPRKILRSVINSVEWELPKLIINITNNMSIYEYRCSRRFVWPAA